MASQASQASSFVFPEIYGFPPFFTQQPNLDTWAKQRQQWCDLILSYAAHHRIYILDINQVAGKAEPFINPTLQRSLPRDTLRLVLEHLVGSMQCAEWESKEHDRCLLFWRKPEEWAALISKWVFDTGRNGTVCTTYEIVHGDDSMDEPFHEIPDQILKKALDVLVKQGKAQLFSSNDGNTGVKFM
eukprot:jgi/Hompol1/363/HPOL_005293-RA